jgi:hypothetical protein
MLLYWCMLIFVFLCLIFYQRVCAVRCHTSIANGSEILLCWCRFQKERVAKCCYYPLNMLEQLYFCKMFVVCYCALS